LLARYLHGFGARFGKKEGVPPLLASASFVKIPNLVELEVLKA
jgi:hypothetical protein